MAESDVRVFCDRWLQAWTGNQAERLIEFYGKDAHYRDPARPDGLNGREELLSYFRKLLARNPNWVWKAKEVIPTQKGFVLKWVAVIPTASASVTVEGLDIVEWDGEKITRNEVYFDRSVLMK